jgi:hypothetical protein
MELIKRVLWEEGEKEGLGDLLVTLFEEEKEGNIGFQWKKAYEKIIRTRTTLPEREDSDEE